MSSLTRTHPHDILQNKLGNYISLGRDTWGLFPMQPSIISESIIMWVNYTTKDASLFLEAISRASSYFLEISEDLAVSEERVSSIYFQCVLSVSKGPAVDLDDIFSLCRIDDTLLFMGVLFKLYELEIIKYTLENGIELNYTIEYSYE